jgi:hypothetical protein
MFTKNADSRAPSRLSASCNCTDREVDTISGIGPTKVLSDRQRRTTYLPNVG